MPRYIVSLGSCHFHAPQKLLSAQNEISLIRSTKIIDTSKTYKNRSVETNFNRLFFNSALAIKTTLDPLIFFRELLAIENFLGRVRPYKNSPRTIDLDILICLDFNFNKRNFILPHKGIINRACFYKPCIEVLQKAKWATPHHLFNSSRGIEKCFMRPL